MSANPLVLLVRRLDHGGAERQLIELAKALHRRGRTVHVLLFYSGGLLDSELAAAGVPCSAADKNGRWDWPGFLWRLGRELRRMKPSAVYSFLDVSNVLAAVLWPFVGRPYLVWSVRAADVNFDSYDTPTRWANRMESWFCKRADVIVANSVAGRHWAVSRGFPQDRLQVIENGTDLQRFRPQPSARSNVRSEWGFTERHCVVGLVARIDPMKDHANFLAAAAVLVQDDPSWRFVCIGSGSSKLLAELKAISHALGLDDVVVWAGARTDIPNLLRGLDIACSSSRFGEGFSNSLAEAMASGVPCVTTDVGDSARLVGELGEVVAAADPLALAEGLRRMRTRLQTEPELRQRAIGRIETLFSLESMVQRTDQLIFGRQP
jgi:glycosyltransferase involved in cell wall biosynthesis